MCFLIYFIMRKGIYQDHEQVKAIRTLLDCSNTKKVKKNPLPSHDIFISPWNHKHRKQNEIPPTEIKLRAFTNGPLRKKQVQPLSNRNRLSLIRNTRRGGREEEQRKSQMSNVIDLSKSLEHEHTKRKNLFLMRRNTVRYKTIQKV